MTHTIVDAPEDRALIIERAALDLEVNGWCRGAYHKGEMSCLVGAVRVETLKANKEFRDLGVERVVYTSSVIKDVGGDMAIPRIYTYDSEANITNWNDDQRDKRKVIRLLRRVARNLRKQVA